MTLNFCIFLMISLMTCQVPVFPQVLLQIFNHRISDISLSYCFVKANEASPLSRNYLILKKVRIGCTDKFECNSKTLKIIICKCVWTCEIKFQTHNSTRKEYYHAKLKLLWCFFSPFSRVTPAVSFLSWTLTSPGKESKGTKQPFTVRSPLLLR